MNPHEWKVAIQIDIFVFFHLWYKSQIFDLVNLVLRDLDSYKVVENRLICQIIVWKGFLGLLFKSPWVRQNSNHLRSPWIFDRLSVYSVSAVFHKLYKLLFRIYEYIFVTYQNGTDSLAQYFAWDLQSQKQYFLRKG